MKEIDPNMDVLKVDQAVRDYAVVLDYGLRQSQFTVARIGVLFSPSLKKAIISRRTIEFDANSNQVPGTRACILEVLKDVTFYDHRTGNLPNLIGDIPEEISGIEARCRDFLEKLEAMRSCSSYSALRVELQRGPQHAFMQGKDDNGSVVLVTVDESASTSQVFLVLPEGETLLWYKPIIPGLTDTAKVWLKY